MNDVSEAGSISTPDIIRIAKKYAGKTKYTGKFAMVLNDVGGFSSPYNILKPCVGSGTMDGVGSKLKIAFETGRHDTIGIDLVAMVANDLLADKLEPAFLHDYIAMGPFTRAHFESVLTGIAKGCNIAGMQILGGESANMRFLYASGEYDLAAHGTGFANVDEYIVNGSGIKPGMSIFGLSSSGIHANGFTKMREVLHLNGGSNGLRKGLLESDWKGVLEGRTLADELLIPTKIYLKEVRRACKKYEITGFAHITGGGLPENIRRILPGGCSAHIQKDSWKWPPIFSLIQREGDIGAEGMLSTFNCGIGFVAISGDDMVSDDWMHIGTVKRGKKKVLFT